MSDMDADRREVWTTNGGSMDAEIAYLRKRLAESEKAGERLANRADFIVNEVCAVLGRDLEGWEFPSLANATTELKSALAEWRARKGGEAVAKKLEHPYSPPSQEDLRRMRDANAPKMPRQDDRPMKP